MLFPFALVLREEANTNCEGGKWWERMHFFQNPFGIKPVLVFENVVFLVLKPKTSFHFDSNCNDLMVFGSTSINKELMLCHQCVFKKNADQSPTNQAASSVHPG